MALFESKAPGIMRKLMRDFGFKDFQAAGIVGNFGTETGGFKHMQEIKPTVPGSAGGYGWAQWTGPRRRAFFTWAGAHGFEVDTDEANYGFLVHELRTTEKATVPAVKRTTSLDAATVAFERAFERAGVKHYESRKAYARRALRAYEGSEPDIPDPPDIEPPEEEDETPAKKEGGGLWGWLKRMIPLPLGGGLFTGGIGKYFEWVDTWWEFLIVVGAGMACVMGLVTFGLWVRKKLRERV